MLRRALKAAFARRSVATITAFLAPVALFGILLGPALIGRTTFGAVDLLEQRAPWRNTTTIDHVTNGCVSDTIDTVLPSYESLRSRLAAGDLVPLWDPLPSAGSDLAAAVESGDLSPIVLATLPFPPNYAPVIFKLLELLAIGLGMWLWFKLIGLSRAASVVASLVFATSGFMVMWTNWPQTRTAAFFPLVFWAVERVVQRQTVRSSWPLALAVGAIVVSGFVAVAAHCIYAAAIYALVRVVANARRQGVHRRFVGPLRTAAIGAAAAITGLGIIGFQLIAFNQIASETDLSYRVHQWRGTLRLPQLISSVFPIGLGSCGELGTWGTVSPIEGNIFIGAAALVLVLAAVTLPRAPGLAGGVRGFLLGGAVVTVLALFWGGPVSVLLHELPLMNNSLMTRIHGISGLFFAVLAGIGYDAIRHRPWQRPGWLGRIALCVAPFLVGALTLITVNVVHTRGHLPATAPSIAIGVASAAIAWFAWLAAVSPRRTRLRMVAIALVPVAIAAEGWIITDAFWPRVPNSELYRQTDTTTYLATHDVGDRTAPVGAAFWGSDPSVYGIRTVTAHSLVTPAWRAILTHVDPRVLKSPTYQKFSTADGMGSRLLDRLATKYFVLPLSDPPLGTEVPIDTGLKVGRGWSGTPLVFNVQPGRLRGLVISLADLPADGFLTATASDGLRTVSARVRLLKRTRVLVPLAGEGFAASRTVTVTVAHSSRSPLDVVTDAAGGPRVAAVYGADQYTLVRSVDAQIYERPTSLDRIRWATSDQIYPNSTAFFTLADALPPSTALLDPQTAQDVPISGAGASVDVVTDAGDSIRVDVTARGDGLLVIADAWRDQWHAYLDGRRVPLEHVDMAVMGVSVPEGAHSVELRYEPAGWGPPLWLGGILLLLTLGVAGWDVSTRVRNRRRGTGPVPAPSARRLLEEPAEVGASATDDSP